MQLDYVRLAYVHLEQPHAAVEGAQPKYSVCCIIPKDHPQIAEIRAEIEATKAAKWGNKPPKGLRSPVRDGDETDDSGERVKGKEFANAYYITASNTRPQNVIVGKAKTPAKTEHMQSGNYGSVKIRFFAYDTPANRGVGAGLNGVWITHPGEPLSAGANEPWNDKIEAEDFDTIVSEATTAGARNGDMF